MLAAGNANVYQNVQHQGIIVAWHFVYFGYSKAQSKAVLFTEFKSGTQRLEFANTNHYWAEKFFFVLRDSRYPNFQGSQALVIVNLGPGAFKNADDYSADGDIFGFAQGSKQYLGTVAPVTVNSGKDILKPSATSDPVFTKDLPLDSLPVNLNEYGYGFWFRFLTVYPVRLWTGKSDPWYFLARLTINQNFADGGFGDRLLANW
jgi:hypothetical protein